MRLKPQFRQTLQAIADRGTIEPDGSIVGAFGGGDLITAAECSRASFWRHVTRLERLGFLVVLSRGGTLNGRNHGNVYGIPAHLGALDGRRARREVRQMLQGADGLHRPVVIRPGDQTHFWMPDSGTQSETGGVSSETGGVVSLGRKSETLPYDKSLMKSHDHGVSQKRCVKKKWWPGRRLQRTELSEVEPLCKLFDHATAAGLVKPCDHDRIWFFSAAKLALIRANEPGAYFATSVRNGQREWWIPEEAQRAGTSLLQQAYEKELIE